jgi:predicted CDP-diglyceride synthetase/phosphatidate cytidylyltransferase
MQQFVSETSAHLERIKMLSDRLEYIVDQLCGARPVAVRPAPDKAAPSGVLGDLSMTQQAVHAELTRSLEALERLESALSISLLEGPRAAGISRLGDR